MSETPAVEVPQGMSDDTLRQLARSYAGIPKETLELIFEKEDLIREVKRLKEVARSLTARLQELAGNATVVDDRERGPADAVRPAEPAGSVQPVLWLFRAGSGPVYASRHKPEPRVLADVLAWTVDGQHCPVSLPLRDWIEPGQRMALVAAPIGGDA